MTKPFAEAPWPTRKPKAEPKAVLSGLTADERRVHRILLDTLAMQNDQGYGQGVVGLSYAEKQRLAVLDLAFIDAEIAKMDRGAEWGARNKPAFAGLCATSLIAAGAALVGESEMALSFGIVTLVIALVFGVMALVGGPVFAQASAPRRKIYDALRELALLADPNDVTSDALAQADAVIDRLAGAPGMAASDHAPRLSLDSETLAPTASASRTRARS